MRGGSVPICIWSVVSFRKLQYAAHMHSKCSAMMHAETTRSKFSRVTEYDARHETYNDGANMSTYKSRQLHEDILC